MREAIYEVLERINNIESEHDRLVALNHAVNTMGRFKDVLYYALSPKVEWDLPEGVPPFKPTHDVGTQSLMWGEIRRLYLFVKPNKLTDARRQALFIELLEFVNPADANVLVSIKEKQWPYDNITAEAVERVAPGLLNQTLTIESGARV